MGLFKKKKKQKVFVLGLDGVPHSMVLSWTRQGKLPNLARIFGEGDLRRMHSVVPTISSVAWASFMTGANPGKHNIYGFVDRELNPFQMIIPNASRIKVPTLWEVLSRAGKRVVVMNVPVTYPPREVNGILVAGFLSTDLSKATFPSEVAERLQKWEYVIDVDPWKGQAEDKTEFLQDLHRVMNRRIDVLLRLMEEEWDYFHCHIMETDRINHFLWEPHVRGDARLGPAFEHFYQEMDKRIGEVVGRLDEGAQLIVLSDHGFCTLRKEVQVNAWLEREGFLKLRGGEAKGLDAIHPESRAYSLLPGRIFINLKGREPMGSVNPGSEYEDLREAVMQSLLEMKDPETDEKILDSVKRREDLYWGPSTGNAADMVGLPRDGYDLKGKFGSSPFTEKGMLNGMHTFHDAFVYFRGRNLVKEVPVIVDLFPTILKIFGIKGGEPDGTSLI